MRGLHYLSELTHHTVLRWRAVEHIIQGSTFIMLWQDSTNDEKEIAKKYILDGDKLGLKGWVTQHSMHNIYDHGVRELRRIAKKRKIPYYTQLRHSELCEEILKRRKEDEQKKV